MLQNGYDSSKSFGHAAHRRREDILQVFRIKLGVGSYCNMRVGFRPPNIYLLFTMDGPTTDISLGYVGPRVHELRVLIFDPL